MAANQPFTPTTDPDPPSNAPAMPAAIGRVLSVVRKLIDYGKALASTVQQRATDPGFARFAARFGTADIAAILACITNGLLRAAALEARLCQRAERGQDLTPPPCRIPTIRGRHLAPPSAPPERERANDPPDPRLARLPTAGEIAAQVRRRPIGVILADICRDFGIAPGDLDGSFWDELNLAIISYGGTIAGIIDSQISRSFAFTFGKRADKPDPGPPTSPRLLPATGPP